MTELPTLSEKHHSARFTGMTPLMAAIVAYVLGESFNPSNIAEVAVTEGET